MKTFKQWLKEVAEPGVTSGEPRISQRQITATKGAKEAATKILAKKPQLAAKISAGGQHARTAQADLSADVGTTVSKNAGQGVDTTKAAFSGVDDMIGDIEKNVNMMKKRMKK